MKRLLLATTALCAVAALFATNLDNPPANVAFAEIGAGPAYIMQLTFIEDGIVVNRALGGAADVNMDAGLIEAPTKDYGLAAMTPVSTDATPLPLNTKKVIDLATVAVLSTDAPPLTVRAKSDFDFVSMVAHPEVRPPMLIAAMHGMPESGFAQIAATVSRSSTTALTMEVA